MSIPLAYTTVPLMSAMTETELLAAEVETLRATLDEADHLVRRAMANLGNVKDNQAKRKAEANLARALDLIQAELEEQA